MELPRCRGGRPDGEDTGGHDPEGTLVFVKPRMQGEDRSARRRYEQRRNRLDPFGIRRRRANQGMLRARLRSSNPPKKSESHHEGCAPTRATEASHVTSVGG